MAKKTEPNKTSQPILGYLIVFIIGFICGVGFAALKMDSGTSPGSASAPAPQQSSETASAIQSLEAEVTGNPENFQAWVQLGHLYYDTGQNEKAITAYTTSLKYHSGDANLLTDLGVMYRRTGKPEAAIEWFRKAQAMDARHLPSRLNEGIVRYYDLKDTEGALAKWEELLAIDPNAKSSNGDSIREFVDHLRAEHEKTQNK